MAIPKPDKGYFDKLSQAVDIVVHTERMIDDDRRIVSIATVGDTIEKIGEDEVSKGGDETLAKLRFLSAAQLRQSQTGQPTEETTYIVHYGEWVNHDFGTSSYYGREKCFNTEDEACQYAVEKLLALAQRNTGTEGLETTKVNDMRNSIWVERRTVTSQTIGFMTPAAATLILSPFPDIRP